MKKNTIILALMLLMAVFQWGCEQESVIPSDDDISTRARGGNGNGNGGNGGGNSGDEEIFRVEYLGALGAVAYGPATQDNKKAQVIGAGDCPTTTMTGIPALVGGCFTDPLVNIWGPTVRLIDRRLSEQDIRISVRFFINYNGSNHWLNFFGSICCDASCGSVGCGTSILPASGESIIVKMDRMVVETSEGCSVDRALTEDVRVKIELAPAEWACE